MDLEAVLTEKAKLIDKELERVFPKKGTPNLNDAVWYHLGTGGKRVRPILGIITCEALGGDSHKILPFAAACEIMHNWLLVHDDIEDNDTVRRNQPALWVKYGTGHAINVGDYMAHKVFELILSSRAYGVDEQTTLRLSEILIDAALKTAEGQTKDMNLRNSNAPTEHEYMDMVTAKTAHYLTLPMLGGAIIANVDRTIVGAIREFGVHAGPAFQITDDVLDLTEGKGRREIGRDIKEGKRSLLVVHCLTKCSTAEKKKLLEILNRPADKTPDADVRWAVQLFEKHGSIAYSQKRAEELIGQAKQRIAATPPALRSVLDEFADFLIHRKR
ncbi:MAG: polyprenyl synthetase family protein [Candidatus Aenigmarchaeota archaeon]|nr:polyprenyl synthetase family protein [Candidatus Aenigmarchaeota archaeon]